MRRGGFRHGRPAKVAEVLGVSLGGPDISRKIKEHRGLIIWAEVVGAKIDAATCPVRVTDGVMFIACRSHVWAQELTFQKPTILEKLNTMLGTAAITDVRFSGIGYKRANAARTASAPDNNVRQDTELDPRDIEAVDCVADPVASDDLREQIRRSMLSVKRRAKALEESETVKHKSKQ